MNCVIDQLVGGSVTRIAFDYALTLTLDSAEITVESPFLFGAPGAAVRMFDPEFIGPEAGTMMQLWQQRVVRADLDEAFGALSLEFGDGFTIEVSTGGKYEPWNVAFDDGCLLIATPDGTICEFPPTRTGAGDTSFRRRLLDWVTRRGD